MNGLTESSGPVSQYKLTHGAVSVIVGIVGDPELRQVVISAIVPPGDNREPPWGRKSC